MEFDAKKVQEDYNKKKEKFNEKYKDLSMRSIIKIKTKCNDLARYEIRYIVYDRSILIERSVLSKTLYKGIPDTVVKRYKDFYLYKNAMCIKHETMINIITVIRDMEKEYINLLLSFIKDN
jgi:hypothetical protein